MSTSENKKRRSRRKQKSRRTLIAYIGITVFCLVFYLVYNRFSHGVHSDYMTFLFLWPLILGVGQKLVRMLLRGLPDPSDNAADFWNAGLAACVVSSALTGIFEIAGTSSVYPAWMMRAGFVMLAVGAVFYVADGIRGHR